MQAEQDLKEKILAITMQIREDRPELRLFLDEIPVPIYDENNHVTNMKNLKKQLKSLNDILKKYS
ncbi:MAG: hypothetical protein GZ094_19325 [Mariniphaga sp.]|nr:hypothetical protein [Mariniphaga sp.]